MSQMFKEVKIGDVNYTIQHFNPTKALSLLTRLTKTVGPTLAVFTNAKDSSDLEAAIPKAIQALVEKIDENETPRLIKDLLDCVTYGGGQKVSGESFEFHFQGKMGIMFKLLIEVVKFQFSDFLSDLLSGNSLTLKK